MAISTENLEKQYREILKFVNTLPIPTKEGKLKLMKKIIEEQYTTNIDEAYVPDETKDDVEEDIKYDDDDEDGG